MASYGGGFAQGMSAGSNMVSNAYGAYRQKKLFDRDEEQFAAREGAISSLFNDGNYTAQQGQDVSAYEQERANLLEGGYQPNEAETQALDHGQQNLETSAPSTLFFNKITGMGSQERLGHMIELSQQSGMKINEASLSALKGVNQLFDSQRQADNAHAQQESQVRVNNAQIKHLERGAGNSYMVLSDEQKANLGLPAGQAFQVDNFGKVSQVGGNGVTINNGGKLPSAPAGYQYEFGNPNDPTTPTGMKIIPGSPAESEVNQNNNERKVEFQSAVDTIDGTTATIDRILRHEGFESATGMTSFMSAIPGTDAKDFSALVEQLQSQQFASQVKTMKGMGALSDSEGKKLSAAVSNLDLGQSSQQFKENLHIAKNLFSLAKQKMSQKYADTSSKSVPQGKEQSDGSMIFPDGSVYREKKPR